MRRSRPMCYVDILVGGATTSLKRKG
jgi:hypothetical protein